MESISEPDFQLNGGDWFNGVAFIRPLSATVRVAHLAARNVKAVIRFHA